MLLSYKKRDTHVYFTGAFDDSKSTYFGNNQFNPITNWFDHFQSYQPLDYTELTPITL